MERTSSTTGILEYFRSRRALVMAAALSISDASNIPFSTAGSKVSGSATNNPGIGGNLITDISMLVNIGNRGCDLEL